MPKKTRTRISEATKGRQKGNHLAPRLCRACRTKFQPTRPWSWYCSPECHDAYWKGLRARAGELNANLTRLSGRDNAEQKKETNMENRLIVPKENTTLDLTLEEFHGRGFEPCIGGRIIGPEDFRKLRDYLSARLEAPDVEKVKWLLSLSPWEDGLVAVQGKGLGHIIIPRQIYELAVRPGGIWIKANSPSEEDVFLDRLTFEALRDFTSCTIETSDLKRLNLCWGGPPLPEGVTGTERPDPKNWPEVGRWKPNDKPPTQTVDLSSWDRPEPVSEIGEGRQPFADRGR